MRPARLVLCALALPLSLAAQGDVDPPARVARISYIQGSVSLRPDATSDWSQAALNYPVTTDNYLWTDAGARAELQVGSTTLQLGPETALQTTALDYQQTQVSITQGTLSARVRELADNEVAEFDTPAGAVSMVRPGDLRVDVSPDGQYTTVTVRHGQAEMRTGGTTFPIPAGNSVVISGTNAGTYDMRDAPALDGFDEWALARDQQQDNAVSAQYVSREMTGYDDLDAYGTWRVVPAYGRVWMPRRVAPGWAPYRYGHWVYVRPWGWTWVDDAPWGFAPFHYGRWAFWSGSWVWVPGTIVARPVYAPALVAFVGGPGWHVSVGVGSAVGWIPLAPGEVYFPSYRVSQRYARNVNITNVRVTNINVTNVNVTNIHYANRGVAGGMTTVPRTVFAGGRPVGRSVISVSPRERDAAPVLGRGVAIAPGRDGMRARSAFAGPVSRPPENALSRRVEPRQGSTHAFNAGATPPAMAPRGRALPRGTRATGETYPAAQGVVRRQGSPQAFAPQTRPPQGIASHGPASQPYHGRRAATVAGESAMPEQRGPRRAVQTGPQDGGPRAARATRRQGEPVVQPRGVQRREALPREALPREAQPREARPRGANPQRQPEPASNQRREPGNTHGNSGRRH